MPKYQEPINLAHLQPKNRIIRSATHSFLPDEQGYMTEAEYSMYEKLAECGVGTIISGHCCVRQGGRANPEQVNIWGDGFADQFTRAADICHAGGALFLPQLSHAGPRAIDTEDLADVSQRDLKKGRHARELTPEEIKAIEGSFIAAAQRLQKAGVDGVQLHGAHSYLLSRFLDPTFMAIPRKIASASWRKSSPASGQPAGGISPLPSKSTLILNTKTRSSTPAPCASISPAARPWAWNSWSFPA